MTSLALLACGDAPSKGGMLEIHTHLHGSLTLLVSKAISLCASADDVDLALYGPPLGRGIIEVALTGVLSRCDPFRILAIRQSQRTAGYDAKKRNPLALNWASDIKGEEGKDWTQLPQVKDLQRGLLSNHYSDLIWKEAFEEMVDSVPSGRGGTWIGSLLRLAPDSFIDNRRTLLDGIYSGLSKGIHHEFVIPMTKQYDRATVIELIRQSIETVAGFCLVASYSPVLHGLKTVPINVFETLQQEVGF